MWLIFWSGRRKTGCGLYWRVKNGYMWQNKVAAEWDVACDQRLSGEEEVWRVSRSYFSSGMVWGVHALFIPSVVLEGFLTLLLMV